MLERAVRQVEAGLDVSEVEGGGQFYWSSMNIKEFALRTAQYNVEFWADRSGRTTVDNEKVNCFACDDVVMGPHDMIVCCGGVYHLACNAVTNPPREDDSSEEGAYKSLAMELLYWREPTLK